MPHNPYQPPSELRRAPFWTRFRRAVGLALRAYRAGMRREGMTPWSHFSAWMSLLLIVFMVMIIAVSWIVEILGWLSVRITINF